MEKHLDSLEEAWELTINVRLDSFLLSKQFVER